MAKKIGENSQTTIYVTYSAIMTLGLFVAQ
jgi:hypothetical protein